MGAATFVAELQFAAAEPLPLVVERPPQLQQPVAAVVVDMPLVVVAETATLPDVVLG